MSSAGNTRGLIEAGSRTASRRCAAMSAAHGTARHEGRESSAGNTRGLIEAREPEEPPPSTRSLPRGIPAASLKLDRGEDAMLAQRESSAGNTRGLIEAPSVPDRPSSAPLSSAGNTRGLIEAASGWALAPSPPPRLPRGIPAASLKPNGRSARSTRPMPSSGYFGRTGTPIELTRFAGARHTRPGPVGLHPTVP